MARFSTLLVVLVAAGCGGAEAPIDAQAATVARVESASDTIETKPTPATQDSESQSPPNESISSEEPAAQDVVGQALPTYNPPFPERLELFEPPQRAQSTIRHDAELGETVELKGFIDAGEPRVVLSIDGVVSSIPEGGEKYGVQVISIEPPTVVLQRGRNRWPATLE